MFRARLKQGNNEYWAAAAYNNDTGEWIIPVPIGADVLYVDSGEPVQTLLVFDETYNFTPEEIEAWGVLLQGATL